MSRVYQNTASFVPNALLAMLINEGEEKEDVTDNAAGSLLSTLQQYICMTLITYAHTYTDLDVLESSVSGMVMIVDISGFTSLTESECKLGDKGTETLTNVLN